MRKLVSILKKVSFLTLFLSINTNAHAELKGIDQARLKEINFSAWARVSMLNSRSYIQDKAFYLSKKEHITPENELYETLVFFQKDKKNKCIYPARYYWLSHHYSWLNLQEDLNECHFKMVDQFSLVYVSSYTGNPASMFGHLFIKTNTSEFRLLDKTYNFGAEIPEKENIIQYITKGLFGYYNASFKESDFFKQNSEYSQNEQRDIIEYPMNLTPHQLRLMNYHLIEIQNKPLQYFYVKQNCAYRIAELLSLVLNHNFVGRKMPWYSPESITFDLQNYKNDEKPLIHQSYYNPSQIKILHDLVKLLNPEQKNIIKSVFKHHTLEPLTALSIEQQKPVLQYLLISTSQFSDHADSDDSLRELNKQVKAYLFKHPIVLNKIENRIEQLPIQANPTSSFKISLGQQQSLSINIFDKSIDAQNSDLMSEMKFMSFSLVQTRHHTLRTQGHFIAMKNLKDLSHLLIQENPFSWGIDLGWNFQNNISNQTYAYLQGQAGFAKKMTPQWVMYGMLKYQQTTRHDQNYLSVQYSSLYKTERYAFSNSLEYPLFTAHHDSSNQKIAWETKLDYYFNKNHSMGINWQKKYLEHQNVALNYQYSW